MPNKDLSEISVPGKVSEPSPLDYCRVLAFPLPWVTPARFCQ
jgi:hypothetical protein